MLSDLRRDVFYAFRQIQRQPGFALVIVLTLGTAMGVNTSFFSMFNASSLKAWSVKDPHRVLAIHPRVGLAEWRHWSESARTLDGLTATLASRSARSESRRLHFDFVSSNHFDVLGPLERGRAFTAAEDRPGGAGTEVVIHHRLWQNDFAGDPQILGRTLRLDGVPFTIVGVAARSFEGAGHRHRDLWLPLSAYDRLQPADAPRDWDERQRQVSVAARLAPQASSEDASAELTALSQQFRKAHGIAAVRIAAADTRPFSHAGASDKGAAALFFLAVTFATLVACANVANLLLARGNARRGEIAMRLSLGAGRPRVIRQLLTEAFVLAAMGSLLGLALANVLPDWVAATIPDVATRMATDFRLDYRVFLYALGLSTVACVAFGLLPALQCTRMSVSQALKDAHGLSVPSLRTSLPGYQVIVSVMLLTASGLLVRSVQHLTTRDPGYSVDDLTFIALEFPSTQTGAQRTGVTGPLMEELRSVTGAANVAGASFGPNPGRPAGGAMYFDLLSAGRRQPGTAAAIEVTESYFDLLRLPIVAGRAFTTADAHARAAIVNEAFVREFSPDANPIGATILHRKTAHEIVGVVRDAHLGALDTVEPVVFQPATPEVVRVLLVKGAGEGLAAMVRPLVSRLGGDVHADVQSGRAWMARMTSLSFFGARMVGGIGVLTLALATLGLFSVSAYTVQQRTREIGIRMALGAQRIHILRAVLSPAAAAMVRGFVIGGAGAVGLAFLMHRWDWLMGLSPLDPATYAGVVAVLILAGLIASYLPARRAMSVEPTVALRYE